MISLNQLEALYWVVRLRSFHAAADRLRLTQPTVSYRVRELEERIGRPLVVRSRRSLRPTAQGQLLVEQAERMMAVAQDMERQFHRGGAMTGALRLGVTDAFAAISLPYLLRLMAEDHPDLDVSVVVDNSHVLIRRLDDGELDIAVVSTPPMVRGLRYEPIGQQLVAWIGGSALDVKAVADPEWIAGARIFVTPPPSNLDAITTGWFRDQGLAMPRLSVCNSMSAIVSLVQAGAGIGILPLLLVETSIAAGTMRPLPLPGAIAAQEIFIAYSKGALDVALPGALALIRRAMRDRRFCE
jgi:DNA-binding transcriptional LysR family regulator